MNVTFRTLAVIGVSDFVVVVCLLVGWLVGLGVGFLFVYFMGGGLLLFVCFGGCCFCIFCIALQQKQNRIIV